MENYVKFKIGAEADVRDIEKMEGAFGKCTGAAKELIDQIKLGAAIDIGGNIVNSIARVPAILKEAIANGVQFNAVLESSRLGIAAIFRQFQGEKFTNFDEADEAAGKAVDALRIKADQTSASFEQLLGSYQSTVGALFAAGITDATKQVNTIGLLANAVAAVVSDKSQLVQETRAILTGQITPDAQAARTFGITSQDIATAKEAGNLYEFLSVKLSAFAEAGERSGQTFSVARDNLKSQITSLEAQIAKPVFDALKQSFIVLKAELENPEVIDALKGLGFEVASLVKTGTDVVTWAIQNADSLNAIAHAAGLVGVAFAAMGIATLLKDLGLSLAAWSAMAPAIEAETAAVTRNTAAMAANAVAARAASAARVAGGGNFSATGNLPVPVRFANAAGGVATAAETAAARASMAGAYGARATGAVSAAGPGLGASLLAGASGLAAVGLVAAIAALVVALNELRVVNISAAKQAREDDSKIKDKIYGSLADKAMSVNSGTLEKTRGALQRAVQTSKGDDERKSFADLLEGLDETAARNDKILAQEKERTAAVETRAKAEEAAAIEAQRREQFKATEPASREAYARAALEEAKTPAEKLDEIERQQGDARKRFADLSMGSGMGKGDISPQAGAAELLAAADKANTVDNANKLRELAAQILGLEKERLSTIDQITDAQQQQAAEQEWRDKRKAALADLHDEHVIAEALINGDKSRAHKIERQRDLRHEIKALEDAGHARPDAEKEAKKTDALKEQLRLKEQGKNVDAEVANNAVGEAELHRSKGGLRDAKLAQFRQQRRAELEDKVPANQLDQLVDEAAGIKERQLRKADGVLGGSTKRSDRDTLGGGIDLLHSGRESIATPMSDSFANAFRKGRPGVGDMLPVAAGNAPAVAGQDGQNVGNADPVKNSVSNTQRAADATTDAARNLKSATDALRSAGQNLAAQSHALNEIAGAIRGLGPNFVNPIRDLKESVNELRHMIANIQGYY